MGTGDEEKLELIKWVGNLNDEATIKRLLQVKRDVENKSQKEVRKFGNGKHLFKYIADDFNDPLDDFKEYMK